MIYANNSFKPKCAHWSRSWSRPSDDFKEMGQWHWLMSLSKGTQKTAVSEHDPYGYQVTCFHLLKCNLEPIGYNLTKQLFFISCMYANNDQVGWKQQKCQNSEQNSWWMLRVRSIYKMHNIIIRLISNKVTWLHFKKGQSSSCPGNLQPNWLADAYDQKAVILASYALTAVWFQALAYLN